MADNTLTHMEAIIKLSNVWKYVFIPMMSARHSGVKFVALVHRLFYLGTPKNILGPNFENWEPISTLRHMKDYGHFLSFFCFHWN